jgi:DNA-binding NtrC family response regulator
MNRAATVLIVDDDPSIRQTMATIVRSAGMLPTAVGSGEEALKLLERTAVEVMLLDVQMPGMSGLEVLRQVRDRQPDVGVIVLSVVREVAVAVEAMRLGALDYLTKDFSPPELKARVLKTLEQLRTSRELVWLREEVAQQNPRRMLLGRSTPMRQLATMADKIAAKPVSVLITGESGTGKEVLARYLHEHSERSSGPFVAVNLPAIPRDLVESTLFGHEKGSFTGAARQSLGKFELAQGGTLFLDEIGELRLDVQSKLLRSLQEREIERVGGERPIQLDLRIICATNRELPRLVQEGTFREDLYWRLKVVPVEVPPLRARSEDVAELAQHFLSLFAARYGQPTQTLSPRAAQLLETYAWPGNVRELQNLMERLVVVCESRVIEESDLPVEITVAAPTPQHHSTLAEAVSTFERNHLRRMLIQTNWNRRACAEQLGIGYSTLKGKLKEHGLANDDSDAE